jgi:hypothetical protein
LLVTKYFIFNQFIFNQFIFNQFILSHKNDDKDDNHNLNFNNSNMSINDICKIIQAEIIKS